MCFSKNVGEKTKNNKFFDIFECQTLILQRYRDMWKKLDRKEASWRIKSIYENKKYLKGKSRRFISWP